MEEIIGFDLRSIVSDPSWTADRRARHLLRHDVRSVRSVDPGGLTNCGYTPEEAASLAPVWAPLLNEWHLFDNPEDATAYASITAKRVPEHAPFFAYGIYQLGWLPS